MYSLGIDIGTQNIRIVVLKEKTLLDCVSKSHFGDVILTLDSLLQYIKERYPAQAYHIGVSGSNAEQFEGFHVVLDIPAIERGARHVCPGVQNVIEIGAQTARYVDCSNDMTVFSISEGCAGGTGSFLEQQAGRVDKRVSAYSNIQKTNRKIPLLSGHCSVFTKTDIIHRQQEGFSCDEILFGICYATVRNIKSNLLKGKKIKSPVVMGGGVALNTGIVIALGEALNLSDKDLLLPESRDYLQAIGTALYANEKKCMKVSKIKELMQAVKQKNTEGLQYTRVLEYGAIQPTDKCLHIDHIASKNVQRAYLGIDVGSTSVNFVLISPDKKIIDTQYLRTKGEPKKVVAYGLNQIKKKYGQKITIDNMGVTGSGRVLIGKMLGAQVIKDEITCQAKAAFFVDNKADTVFEIGGQDSKYIRIKNGQVVDFQMNKICAAGTGSFLEEQAKYLGIDINDYGKVALTSKSPVELGERCTVFIENNVSASLSQGAKKEDILAGLCHSVIRNYLSKVVGTRKIGNRIILQGGVCFNEAVIAAFQSFYGEKVTVSPVFSVSGAFGAALFAAENTAISKSNQFIEAANSRLFSQTEHFLLENYNNNQNNRKITIGIPRVLMIHRYFPLLHTFFDKIGFQTVLSKKSDVEIISLSSVASSIDTCYPIKLAHGHIQQLMNQKLDYVLLPRMFRLCEAKTKDQEDHPVYGCPYMQAFPELVKSSEIKVPEQTTLLEFDFGEHPLDKRLIELGKKLGAKTSDCIAAVQEANCVMKQYLRNIRSLNAEAVHSFSKEEKIFVIVTRNYNTADPILGMGMIEALSKRGYRVITAAQLPLHDVAHKVIGDEPYAFGQHIVACAHLIRNTAHYYGIYLTNHGCGQDTMVSHLFANIMGDKPCLNIEIDEHFSKVGLITRVEAFINTVEQHGEDKKAIALYHVSDKKAKHMKRKKLYIPSLPPYSMFIQYYLQKKGYDAVLLPPHDGDIIEKAAEYCTSKEYYAFVNYMADVVYMNEQNIHGAALMLFTTEESDAEAMYGQVLRKYMNNNVIIQFFMEEVFEISYGGNDLFYYILLGDLYLNSDEHTKADISALLKAEHAISVSHILKLVQPIDDTKKYVFVSGEPTITYNASIQNKIQKQCKLAGYQTLYMPYSEYLCSIEKNKRNKEQHIEILEKIAVKQGRLSIFSKNTDNKAMCSELHSFNSGNGKYRYMKHIEMSHKNIPGIMISSMYENTQTILSSLFEKQELQALNLVFEGRDEKTQYNKLESFLFYLKNGTTLR